MATREQLTKWSTEVLALIEAGMDNVDEIIRKRHSRMGTLMAINLLLECKKIVRAGNTVWVPGKKQFFGSPF